MSGRNAADTSIAKSGKGPGFFLAFVGRVRRSRDPPRLSAKSDPLNDLLGLVFLIVFGGMIGVVLWRLVLGAL